jgi:hypothetical protein
VETVKHINSQDNRSPLGIRIDYLPKTSATAKVNGFLLTQPNLPIWISGEQFIHSLDDAHVALFDTWIRLETMNPQYETYLEQCLLQMKQINVQVVFVRGSVDPISIFTLLEQSIIVLHNIPQV